MSGFPRDAIRLEKVPRPPEGAVEALMALSGVTSLVSDALGALGIEATIGGSTLRPVIPNSRIVGPALTLRKVWLPADPAERPALRGDRAAHALTSPGDVLVIRGHRQVSNMGGLSARASQRQGGIGAIIWGGSRDVADQRQIGYPVWSTEITPLTGVGRQDGVEINGDIEIGRVLVRPGDLAVADDDGVCFIPRDRIAEIVDRVLARAGADDLQAQRLRSGG